MAVDVEAVQHVLNQGEMQRGGIGFCAGCVFVAVSNGVHCRHQQRTRAQAGSMILRFARSFGLDQFAMSSVSASLASSMAETVVRVEGAVVLRRGEKPVIERAGMVEVQRGQFVGNCDRVLRDPAHGLSRIVVVEHF